MHFLSERANFTSDQRSLISMLFIEHQYYVYLMSNRSKTIARRVIQHKLGVNEGFTKKYKVDRLVLFRNFSDIVKAIAREKQIKSWRREKKVALINSMNPAWQDLRKELMVSTLM